MQMKLKKKEGAISCSFWENEEVMFLLSSRIKVFIEKDGFALLFVWKKVLRDFTYFFWGKSIFIVTEFVLEPVESVVFVLNLKKVSSSLKIFWNSPSL